MDYQLVKDLHTKAGMLDAYDAAVIEGVKTDCAHHQEASKRRPGLAEYSAVALGWRLGSLLHCSHSPE